MFITFMYIFQSVYKRDYIFNCALITGLDHVGRKTVANEYKKSQGRWQYYTPPFL